MSFGKGTRFRWIIVAALAGVVARGQVAPPLNSPAPLVRPSAEASPGAEALSLSAAQRAQALGMPTIAANLYRGLLEKLGAGMQPEIVEERARLTLALASALLEAGRA